MSAAGAFLPGTRFDIQSGDLIGSAEVDLIASTTFYPFMFFDPRLVVFEGPVDSDTFVEGPALELDFTPLSPAAHFLVHDMNSDGVADLALAVTGSSPDNGILIWFGPLGLDFDPLDEPDVRLAGSPIDGFSRALVPVGDVTGDGLEDIVLTHAYHDDLIPGPFDISRPLEADRIRIHRPDATSGIQRVQGDVDIDGDGFNDLIVGDAPGCDRGYYICSFAYPSRTRPGRVHILSGPITAEKVLPDDTSILLEGEEQWDYAGAALSATADLNGDGFRDLVVGAPEPDLCAMHVGWSLHASMPEVEFFDCDEPADARAYVLFGPVVADQPLSAADVVLDDTIWNGRLGTALDTADVDGDGWEDLLITAPNGPSECVHSYAWTAHKEEYGFEYHHPFCPEDTTTRAYIVHGPLESGTAAISERGALLEGLSGWGATSLRVLGDLDGDGDVEFAVQDAPTPEQGYRILSSEDLVEADSE